MKGYERYKENVKAGDLLNMMTVTGENEELPLFKYTPSLEYCLDMLINERIHVSSASTFNDVFDSLPTYQEVKYDEKGDRLIAAAWNRVLIEQTTNVQKEIRVACFSERVNSSIMWGHYAGSHSGFCLEYRVGDIAQDKNDLLLPVIYTKNRFTGGKCTQPEFNDFVNQIRVVIHKEEDWKYEHEWRLIKKSEEDKERFIKNVSPSALYIGCRNGLINNKLLPELQRICIERDIKMYLMNASPDKYEMMPLVIYGGKGI